MEISEYFPISLFSKSWKRISPVLQDDTYLNYERIAIISIKQISTPNVIIIYTIIGIASSKPSMLIYTIISTVRLPCNTNFHHEEVLFLLSKRGERGTLGFFKQIC